MTEISKSSYLEHAQVLGDLFTSLLNNLPDLSSNLAYYTVITMKNIVSVIGGHQQVRQQLVMILENVVNN